MEQFQKVVKMYPDYFPWQTSYNAVPQEVHNAYYEAKNKKFASKSSKSSGKGILELIREAPRQKAPKELSVKTIEKVFHDLFHGKDKRIKEAIKRKEKEKKLWDKYYKRYFLEYRG